MTSAGWRSGTSPSIYPRATLSSPRATGGEVVQSHPLDAALRIAGDDDAAVTQRVGIHLTERRPRRARTAVEGTEVREPQALKAALRRGVAAITAGEPYLLDVRVAPVGKGAESTWHQRFKLRGG